jgi:hypothetical protein
VKVRRRLAPASALAVRRYLQVRREVLDPLAAIDLERPCSVPDRLNAVVAVHGADPLRNQLADRTTIAVPVERPEEGANLPLQSNNLLTRFWVVMRLLRQPHDGTSDVQNIDGLVLVLGISQKVPDRVPRISDGDAGRLGRLVLHFIHVPPRKGFQCASNTTEAFALYRT